MGPEILRLKTDRKRCEQDFRVGIWAFRINASIQDLQFFRCFLLLPRHSLLGLKCGRLISQVGLRPVLFGVTGGGVKFQFPAVTPHLTPTYALLGPLRLVKYFVVLSTPRANPDT